MRRDLPWRESTDFYRVWLSEIMLQQTRVEAAIPYYRRFLDCFPTVEALAGAEEQEVLAAWSGLGYYSRARNLHRAARQIVAEGTPSTLEGIASLPGVGDYTSAAIASIVFGLPHAALDGNVIRVVSRLTNDTAESSSPAARKRFRATAQELLDPQRPGDFNQALMELGATVCKPGNPSCGECPVVAFCAARAAGTERELPVKQKKGETREVLLELVVLRRGGKVLLVRRGMDERRLAGFFELPEKKTLPGLRVSKLGEFTHQIVNDRFQVRVWVAAGIVQDSVVPDWVVQDDNWYPENSLGEIPLTTTARKALAIA